MVRWAGRGIGLLVLAYLVLLGASLARAPWAPRISLPGLGPVTPPVLHSSPPSLGAHALTTPVPRAVVEAGAAPASPGSARGSTTPVTYKASGTTTTAAGTGATTTTRSTPSVTAPRQTTTTTSGTRTTSTTRSNPSATAPGQTTTTTGAGGTTSTSRGRSGSHP